MVHFLLYLMNGNALSTAQRDLNAVACGKITTQGDKEKFQHFKKGRSYLTQKKKVHLYREFPNQPTNIMVCFSNFFC